MPNKSSMGLEEDLDDAKALDLLCGTDADQRRAGYYFYEKFSQLVMNCVRAQFRSLPSDLVVDAVHDAFIAFANKAANDRAFDQDHPERYIIKIALNRACDLFRGRTGRGKFKEQCIAEIAALLDGTVTAKEWSLMVERGSAREIQDLFHKQLEQCGDRQRKVGRLMVDNLVEHIGDADLAELYRKTYNEPITVPATKRAREEVRKKFRDLLASRFHPAS